MIILNDDYAIDVTQTSYNLVRMRVSNGEKTKGETQTSIIGFFTDISGVLKCFGKEMVRDNLKTANITLQDALKRISDTNAMVAKTIEDAMKGAQNEN